MVLSITFHTVVCTRSSKNHLDVVKLFKRLNHRISAWSDQRTPHCGVRTYFVSQTLMYNVSCAWIAQNIKYIRILVAFASGPTRGETGTCELTKSASFHGLLALAGFIGTSNPPRVSLRLWFCPQPVRIHPLTDIIPSTGKPAQPVIWLAISVYPRPGFFCSAVEVIWLAISVPDLV